MLLPAGNRRVAYLASYEPRLLHTTILWAGVTTLSGLIKKVLIIILVFGKVFRTNVVSMAIQSYNQLKFLNWVTMATTKIV